MRSPLVVFVVLPLVAAALSWVIGVAWHDAGYRRDLDGFQAVFWTVVVLSVPVAALAAFLLRGQLSGRVVLGVTAGVLSVVFVGLSMIVWVLLYPPT